MSDTSPKRPLRTMFLLTSMPVGGAETLLVNLVRSVDRSVLEPEICCLKQPGPLGEQISNEIRVHHGFIRFKYDVLVVWRLMRLFWRRKVDAVVTVGAGDKMFWGRIAAYVAGVPVIASAIHSTGWPDGLGLLNRRLTSWTDAFIAVAAAHRKFLVDHEKLPAEKVRLIPNGVKLDRFVPLTDDKSCRRRALNLPEGVPICGIVAALRPEKNHSRFLRIAAEIRRHHHPLAEFLIIGEGPLRQELESYREELGLQSAVHFLGSRFDIDQILPACDVFMLTSDNEASPVSIIEAMACGLPVVAPNVGSVRELVVNHQTGFTAHVNDEPVFIEHLSLLLRDTALARRLGQAGRTLAMEVASLDQMVRGYQQLITTTYDRKTKVLTSHVRSNPWRKMWSAMRWIETSR